ncbi:MAG: methyl-accepting chemotaxis protein [Devosia sp.]|nr:methyl-accepting chemotaxis protein [Devosia sp.]
MTSSSALRERLAFIQFNGEAQQHICDAKTVIMAALPHALDGLYQQIQSFPESRRSFDSQGMIDRAKGRQIAHWETISSGRCDEQYVAAVIRVGEAHAQIGLEPRWYVGGYSLLLDSLIGAAIEAYWPKGGFGPRKEEAKHVAAALGALAKATLLDMDFAISVYLEAAEAARLKAEALASERARIVRSVGDAMRALAGGDLTYRMPDTLPAEYRQLREDFNSVLGTLEQIMDAIVQASRRVMEGAGEIAGGSSDLSRRTEQHAVSLEETAAALDQITAAVGRSADGAKQAQLAVSEAKGDAVRSGHVVREAVDAMGEIEQSSKQIALIIGVIDEIAFQTNLLALNAGVEAARAGDAGRGFAVVAQEVRALAQRSANAAKEIKALISGSSRPVERGVRLVGDTGHALNGIVGKVTAIDTLVADTSASAREQSTGLSEVNTAINRMDQITQQNAAMVEEASAAAAGLTKEAEVLANPVERFEIANGASAQSVALVHARRPGDSATIAQVKFPLPVGRLPANVKPCAKSGDF